MAAEELPLQRPNAWLLDFGQSVRAAVGTRVMLQIINDPKPHPVPCAPSYCRSVVSWQGRLLPVMDMAARLGGAPQVPRLLAVAAYQTQSGAPTQYGALLLDALPVAIAVGDAQSCSLPEQPVGWEKYSLSCFDHNGVAIPVLHLAKIFARPDDV